MLSLKESIDILLKEYDSILAEISEKTNTFQVRTLPLVIVVAGFLVGWHNNIPIQWFVLLLPTAALLLVDISLTSWFYMDRAGRWLALIENKIFLLSESTLLSHQTSLALARRTPRRIWSWLILAGALPAFYGWLEMKLIGMNSDLLATIQKVPGSLIIVSLAVVLPGLRIGLSCMKIFLLRRIPLCTELSKIIVENRVKYDI